MSFLKSKTLQGALGLLLAPGVASASDFPLLSINLCTLNFSKIAYQKPVKNVMAHTGILKDCSRNLSDVPYWSDIHDVNLKGDSDLNFFAGKILLKDRSSTYQACKTSPIVQFWITFEDGTVKIEEPVLIKIASSHSISSEAGSPEARKVVLDYGKLDLNSITTVSCDHLSSYGDIAYRFISSVDPSLFPDFY